MASGAATSGAANTGLQTILFETRQCFLNPEEIQAILNNYLGNIELRRTPVNLPAGGSLFLFNKNLVPKYRNDRYSWKRKFRGDINEIYKNLQIDGQDVICSHRVRAHNDPDFERRTYYSLIDNFCPCFASGSYCNKEYKCYECLNTEEYEEDIEDARVEALRLDESAFAARNSSVSFTCDCVGDNCLKRYCLCCKARIMGSSSGTCLNLDIQRWRRRVK